MSGRPQAPRVISNNVMMVNMLQALEVIPKDIYYNMHDRMIWLQWFATHRLIRKNSGQNSDCSQCNRPIALVKRAESAESYSWKCRN